MNIHQINIQSEYPSDYKILRLKINIRTEEILSAKECEKIAPKNQSQGNINKAFETNW